MKFRIFALVAVLVGGFVYATSVAHWNPRALFSSLPGAASTAAAPIWSGPAVAQGAGLSADEVNNVDIYKRTGLPVAKEERADGLLGLGGEVAAPDHGVVGDDRGSPDGAQPLGPVGELQGEAVEVLGVVGGDIDLPGDDGHEVALVVARAGQLEAAPGVEAARTEEMADRDHESRGGVGVADAEHELLGAGRDILGRAQGAVVPDDDHRLVAVPPGAVDLPHKDLGPRAVDRLHGGLVAHPGEVDLAEAERARAAGWRKPILLLEGCFAARDLEVVERLGLTTTVHEPGQLQWLAAARPAQPLPVYLKLNTGMNRLGFAGAAAPAALAQLRVLPQVELAAVAMHFANADAAPGTAQAGSVALQLAAFERLAGNWRGARSLCNSAALLTQPSCTGCVSSAAELHRLRC